MVKDLLRFDNILINFFKKFMQTYDMIKFSLDNKWSNF